MVGGRPAAGPLAAGSNFIGDMAGTPTRQNMAVINTRAWACGNATNQGNVGETK